MSVDVTDEMVGAAKAKLNEDYRLHRHLTDLGIKRAIEAALSLMKDERPNDD